MITTVEFIEKARLIYNDRYDYSKTIYINAAKKIIIICKIHGEFLQRISCHLNGSGCLECFNLNKVFIFIEKAKEIHGNKYNYDNVVYSDFKNKIIITCKEHGNFLQRTDCHLNKKGCKECSYSNKRSNTDKFLQKIKLIHKDKYDYSKVVYTGCKNKINIICKIHGLFEQRAGSHLEGRGCNLCKIDNRKSNTDKFIEKAKEIHGDKYIYDSVNYARSNSKVILICKIHGEFQQTSSDHLDGKGCSICGKTKKINTEEFIEKSKLLHKDRYDYTESKYTNLKAKISIICKEHGIFSQTANHHLQGKGCALCSKNKKLTTKEFITRSNKVHNNVYDYSKVKYVSAKIKVIIICKKHGEFEQNADSHLRGCSCPECVNKNYSKVSIEWLEYLSKKDSIYIIHALNEGEFKIPDTNFRADGYCKENNTIFEFHGSFFHGSPNLFNPKDTNTMCNMTYGELYERTLKREEVIKSLGYNLVVIWEEDWNKLKKEIKYE